MKNILDKMASRGVEALSDRELLALLTDDEQLAEVVLSAYDGSLARIGDQPEARLRMVGGLGLKRARMLLAAAEFGRRAVASGGSGSDFINTGDDVVRLFRPQLERSPTRSAGSSTSPRRTGLSSVTASVRAG